MTSWRATPAEARALAKVVQCVRNRSGGNEWHLAGIEDALDKFRDLAPYPDLAHAAIAAAREPSNRTPAVIGLEGPHWRQAEVPPSWKPVDPWSLCHDCSLTKEDCAKKQLGFPPGDRHVFRSRGEVANAPALKPRDVAREEAKAALRAAKAALCPHGVAKTVKCALCEVEHPDPTASVPAEVHEHMWPDVPPRGVDEFAMPAVLVCPVCQASKTIPGENRPVVAL